jgi:sulfur-oxidizing protein SoxZ
MDHSEIPAMRSRVPHEAKAGELIEIRVMIMHPMSSGFEMNPQGTMIPRRLIDAFTCRFNGAEIFRVDFTLSIAANPYLSFYTVAVESGQFELTWHEEKGALYTETASIAVS